MANNSTIAIIVEGDYEKKIINNIKRNYFNNRFGYQDYLVLCLPTDENIYMLWKSVQEDSYLDIIELLRDKDEGIRRLLNGYNRESFGEIYLFYDYDRHQNNLRKGIVPLDVLEQMLTTFDNETEQGKLYISYPMAEAVNDFKLDSCETYTNACYQCNTPENYKRSARNNDNPMSHISALTRNKWGSMVCVYRYRLSCLQKSKEPLNLADCKALTPLTIYRLQSKHEACEGSYIVLSAFPEFLIDYFPAVEFTDIELHMIPEYRFSSDCEFLRCT